jgi:hypothetical protein
MTRTNRSEPPLGETTRWLSRDNKCPVSVIASAKTWKRQLPETGEPPIRLSHHVVSGAHLAAGAVGAADRVVTVYTGGRREPREARLASGR